MDDADKTLVATLLASALADAERELQAEFQKRGLRDETERNEFRKLTYVAVIKLWMGNNWRPADRSTPL